MVLGGLLLTENNNRTAKNAVQSQTARKSMVTNSRTSVRTDMFNPFPHNTARYIVVENIVRKGEIACSKQFLLS